MYRHDKDVFHAGQGIPGRSAVHRYQFIYGPQRVCLITVRALAMKFIGDALEKLFIRLCISAVIVVVSIPVTFLLAVVGSSGGPIGFSWFLGYVCLAWSFLPLVTAHWVTAAVASILWLLAGWHANSYGHASVKGYPFEYWAFATALFVVMVVWAYAMSAMPGNNQSSAED